MNWSILRSVSLSPVSYYSPNLNENSEDGSQYCRPDPDPATADRKGESHCLKVDLISLILIAIDLSLPS